ncbi:MAG: ribonuclease III [Prevotella sp.]|nr:ribonuclease III [Prevotella sp.]
MLNNLFDRIRLPFRKEKELFSALYDIIGFYPKDIRYYKLALMHKSIMRREKGKPLNNERLEFLGDAILGAVVGDIVYRHFEKRKEGFLTNTRSKIVQRDTLNKLAEETGLTKLIISSGHISSHNNYMGGNAFEALVGAIYLDKGYDACMRFMQKRILKQLINIDKVAYKEVNFKSKLIEWSQKNKVQIDFELVKQNKDETGSPTFQYAVVLEGVKCCTGKGYSKKESQQEASKLTLERLRREPQLIESIFAGKSERTKMEEEPVSVTELGEINEPGEPRETGESEYSGESEKTGNSKEAGKTGKSREPDHHQDDFDLSDISVKLPQMSKEDIIAAAETAAFNGEC